MTPLERAKAFVQSRAAKTALKILPLALAAVAVATPAKADVVQFNPTNAVFTGCTIDSSTKDCKSGGLHVDSQTTSWALLTQNGQIQGAHGDGSASAHFESTSTDIMDFILSGDAGSSTLGFFNTTPPTDSVPVRWDFKIDPQNPLDPYNLSLFVSISDGINPPVTTSCVLGTGLTGAGHYQTSDLPAGSCDPTGLSGLGAPTKWSVKVEMQMSGDNGDMVNWNQSLLEIGPSAPVSNVPEPATLTLSLIAIPFLVRRLRKN